MGIDNEKIESNPAARIKRRTENNSRVRFLTDNEEKALRAAITDPRQSAALDISIHTGMRQSEQFSLLWSQVDLEKRLVFLPKTKNGDPRHIQLNSVAVTAFESLREVKECPRQPLCSLDALVRLCRAPGDGSKML